MMPALDTDSRLSPKQDLKWKKPTLLHSILEKAVLRSKQPKTGSPVYRCTGVQSPPPANQKFYRFRRTTTIHRTRFELLLPQISEDEFILSPSVTDIVSERNESIRKEDAMIHELENHNNDMKIQLRLTQAELLNAQCQKSLLETTVRELTAHQLTTASDNESLKMQLNSAEKEKIKQEIIIRNLEHVNAKLNSDLQATQQKMIEHELMRRNLHNMIQELKGNIRVFCRIKPLSKEEYLKYKPLIVTINKGKNSMEITETVRPSTSTNVSSPYPTKKASPYAIRTLKTPIAKRCASTFDKFSVHYRSTVMSRNAEMFTSTFGKMFSLLQTPRNLNTKRYTFNFDKIFGPSSQQQEVFNEISQLVQSALDGYNVCILAYGETGSGKTYTMEGPGSAEHLEVGMIPRAIEQIFDSINNLQPLGWTYTIEGSFIEIYNDKIRDLLGNPIDNSKHEIKMSNSNGDDVFVTNLNIIKMESQDQLHGLFKLAQKNRVVASTRCNDRSSRSHFVFQLCLTGKNSITNESCKGKLNLVDLAGSEQLKNSLAEGERLKETQFINSSLSALGRVIAAMARKDETIPFRTSLLTHLLKASFSANSKTLMFVNISLKEENLNATLHSLRFASTVNNCHLEKRANVK